MANMEGLDILLRYLPFLIPLAVIQIGLMIAALVHICTHTTYKMGNRTLWIVLSVAINVIGPILYFVLGRGDE